MSSMPKPGSLRAAYAGLGRELERLRKENAEIRSALESRQGVAVPAGYVLVPANPTQEMCNAVRAWTDAPRSVYLGMIAAAPQPPAVKEAEPLFVPPRAGITIDRKVFRELVDNYCTSASPATADHTYRVLVEYADLYAAQQREAGYHAGFMDASQPKQETETPNA